MNKAELSYIGEIRFGPPYFVLSINGIKIEDRLFSEYLIWSENKQLLAVEEWTSTKESNGPRMKLTIFDLESYKEYSTQTIHGYCVPKHFEDNLLIYEKRNWSKGYEEKIIIELNLEKINEWKPNQTLHLI